MMNRLSVQALEVAALAVDNRLRAGRIRVLNGRPTAGALAGPEPARTARTMTREMAA